MAAETAGFPHFARLAAFALLVGACDPFGSGRGDRYSVSIYLEPAQYDYDLRILLVNPGTPDTLDTLFIGRPGDSTDLERLPASRFRGGPVDAVIWGFQEGIFQWYEVLRYRLPGETPLREKVTRKKFLPAIDLPIGSESDTLYLAQGEKIDIDTPTCVSQQGEPLRVEASGILDTGTPGSYTVRFACEDSLGYKSEGARSYRVLPKDSLDPILSVVGRDTLKSFAGERPRGVPVSCMDYKQRPLAISVSGRVDSSFIGYYPVRYSCRDSAGRSAEITRVFSILPAQGHFRLLKATQETGIDVNMAQDNQNVGYNGWLPLTKLPIGGFFSFIQFDLAEAKALGPSSVRIRLHVFGTGAVYPDSLIPCLFEIWAPRSAWSEGHGNWYYNDGAWRLNGEQYFRHYPMTEEVKVRSLPPNKSDGLLFSARDMVEEADSIVSLRQSLPMTSKHGRQEIPMPDDLVTLELDVTDYALAAQPQDHHGFLICFKGTPDGTGLGFLTKEAGDGRFAPQLVVEY